MGSIYKITNTANGKSYIGQTIHDAEKTRIRYHFAGRGNQLVKRAIEKYGQDAFTYEILHDGIIPDFLDILEIEAIAKFNTLSPHGYNLTTGGEGGSPSDETRQKHLEAIRHPEVRQKHLEATKGENNPMYGKSHRERTGYPTQKPTGLYETSVVKPNPSGLGYKTAKTLTCHSTTNIGDYGSH